MRKRKYKWGYCRNCIKNVPHLRHAKSILLRFADLLTLGILSWLRIGPWYCEQCERKVAILKPTRFDAADFRSDTYREDDDESAEEIEQIQSAGNYLKTDCSLVMRSTRLRRFSEKYRDSLVRRLLDGKVSIADLRQERNVTEAEILDWISDRFRRLETQIELLKSGNHSPLVIEHQPNAENELDQSHESTHFDNAMEGTVVQGQVKPK